MPPKSRRAPAGICHWQSSDSSLPPAGRTLQTGATIIARDPGEVVPGQVTKNAGAMYLKSPAAGGQATIGGAGNRQFQELHPESEVLKAAVEKLSPGMTSQPGDPVNHDKTAVVGGVLVAAPRLVRGARSLIGGLRGVGSALRGAAGRTGQVTATAGRAAPRRSPGPLVVLRWQLAVVSRYAGCSTSGETPPSRGSSNLDGESWIWQAVR